MALVLHRGRPLILLLLFGANACDSARDTRAQVEPAAAPPFDLQALVENAKLAYVWDGDTAVGGHAQLGVRAHAGVVDFTPRHSLTNDPTAEPGIEARAIEGAPLSLETISIARGVPFELPAARTKIAGDGNLSIDRGIAEERFANDAWGTEQSWRFDALPHGKGDLVVRVRASGQAYAGWTEDGHHFVDERTGVGVRYGLATWIDAAGKSAGIPVHIAGDCLELTVSEQLLLDSAYPAVLDPTVSAESGVANVGVGASPYRAELPAVATNGTEFLVVWADQRKGSRDIDAARVTAADGIVLDPLGVELAGGDGDQTNPAIAWNGVRYLVVWQDSRSGDFDLYGQLLSSDGTLFGGQIAIATGLAGNQQNPVIATSGTTFVVAWEDERSGTSNAFFTRIDDTGTRLDGSGVALSAGAVMQRLPGIACSATQCLIAWQHNPPSNEEIAGARVDTTSGSVQDATPMMIGVAPGRDLSPAVGFDGTNYLVVWRRTGDIRGSRITTAGAALDPATGFLVSTVPLLDQSTITVGATTYTGGHIEFSARGAATGVIVNGGRCDSVGSWSGRVVLCERGLISFYDKVHNAELGGAAAAIIYNDVPGTFEGTLGEGFSSTIVAIGLSQADGQTLIAGSIGSSCNVSSQIIVSGNGAVAQQQNPVITFDGTLYYVAWQDARTDGVTYDIYGARVDTTGAVVDVDGRVISYAASSQTFPQIIFGAGKVFVVWQDGRSETPAVYGARIFPDNAVVQDPYGISISRSAARQFGAQVVYDGTRYVAVYADNHGRGAGDYDISAMRINRSGVVLDFTGITVAAAVGNQTAPDIAWNGSVFLIVWRDQRSGTGSDIYGVRVDSALRLLDPLPLQICVQPGDQLNPSVSAGPGGNFLVVWDDARSGTQDIYARRVTGTGALLDGAAGVAITTAAGAQSRPRVASNGNRWLIAWLDSRPGVVGGGDIYANAYDPTTGVVFPGADFLVSGAAGREGDVRVVFNGATNFFAVWTDIRSGTGADIYGARIDSNTFTTLDPSGISLAADSTLGEARPAIAVTGTRYFVVWRRFDTTGGGDVDLWGRQFNFDGTPAGVLSAISADTGDEDQPALAAQGATAALVAYQRYIENGFRGERFRERRVTLP